MRRSLAALYRGGLCAVVLTGTGQNGLAGARLVRRHGGQIVAQNEATSVVWEMPGALVRDGLADHVLPVPDFATLLRPRACRNLAGAACVMRPIWRSFRRWSMPEPASCSAVTRPI